MATLHDLFAHVSPDFADEEFRAHRVALATGHPEPRGAHHRRSANAQAIYRYTDFPEDRVDVVHEGIRAASSRPQKRPSARRNCASA
ncbi:MAG: hypothetical protein R3E96_09125 [Planctomycetota bacterium]